MSLFDILKRRTKPAMGSPTANDIVRRRLAAMGDDGSSVRPVVHYAYPETKPDPTERREIIVVLMQRGFEVNNTTAKDGLALEHYSTVERNDFDQFTAELAAWFEDRGWDYAGWECAVEPCKNTVH